MGEVLRSLAWALCISSEHEIQCPFPLQSPVLAFGMLRLLGADRWHILLPRTSGWFWDSLR